MKELRKDQVDIKEWCTNKVLEAVSDLFEGNFLTNAASDIESACVSVGKDEIYIDSEKSRIILTCVRLLASLISVSESYNDYRNFQRNSQDHAKQI